MNEIQKYIAAHEPKMMDDLFSLIRIPSISALPEHHDDMLACAERWAQLLLEAGVDEALVMPSQGNPVVFAQKIVNPDAKTVLIYAHYDVMPAEPLELWKSEPFEPEIRDGHIWARGADDDKGQSFIQVKAFEYLVKNGLLKNNVKFIFEGEEEIGSPSLEAFCEEHKELLKADVILVSDTSMLGAELPSLTTGLRGLAYWEIEVTGPNRDLHSGHFGGAVANPINALCQIISKVTDADGRITVPGFYDDVEEVPQTEREMIAHIPFNEDKYKEGKNEVLREFLFSCYTSLSFAEFSEVTYGDLKLIKLKSKEAYPLLCNERTKTNISYKIPIVSPIVVRLLENGESFQKIFDPLTNQPTNRYLKEIMKDLKINKTMTFHRARHSFRTIAAKKGIKFSVETTGY